MQLETNINICLGAGLISLDVLIRDGANLPVSYYVGGTCGNVMMILSYMGWDAYPISRLDGTKRTPQDQRFLAGRHHNCVKRSPGRWSKKLLLRRCLRDDASYQ